MGFKMNKIPDWIVRVYLIALRGHRLNKVIVFNTDGRPYLFASRWIHSKNGLQAFINGLQDE